MRKFLLVIHSTRKAASDADWNVYVAFLLAGKHLIGGSSLGPGEGLRLGESVPVKARTVGGYMVIQARSVTAARALVKRCPAHVVGGQVDLFPLVMTG